MNVVQEIKRRIEDYCQELCEEDALMLKARSGRVGPFAVASYLTSLQHNLRETPRHLLLAEEIARGRDRQELAKYFHSKWEEEVGHDLWAAEDLAVLRGKMENLGTVEILNSARSLMAYVEETIRRDPGLYVPYVLFAEYMTVLTGPVWVSALCDSCGIPKAALSVVDKHVVADAEHAEEGFQVAEALIDSPEQSLLVLAEYMRLFREFANEISEIPN